MRAGRPIERKRHPEKNAKLRPGLFAFAVQYQQALKARGGNLITFEWLTPIFRALPVRFESLVLSLDTAYKIGPGSPTSVTESGRQHHLL